jgi:hypothetical protein
MIQMLIWMMVLVQIVMFWAVQTPRLVTMMLVPMQMTGAVLKMIVPVSVVGRP